MTKTELLNSIASETNLPKTVVDCVLEAAGKVIVEAASNDEVIRFPNLGIFKPQDRAARQARNPRTGEPVDVPAKKVLKFTRKEAL